jgi:hypothetical protein
MENFIMNWLGTWTAQAYPVSQIFGQGSGVSYLAPVVLHNGIIYISTDVTSPPQSTDVPGVSNKWSVGQGQTYNASKLFSFLNSAQTLAITSTASNIPLSNSTNFTNQIVGSGITVDPSGNFITLAAGVVWTLTLTAQGINFATAADELQVYHSVSTNAGVSYTDAPAFLRASSIGIGTVGASVKGSGMSRTIILDTTANGYNQAIRVLIKAIVVQSGETCDIETACQFSVSIVS